MLSDSSGPVTTFTEQRFLPLTFGSAPCGLLFGKARLSSMVKNCPHFQQCVFARNAETSSNGGSEITFKMTVSEETFFPLFPLPILKKSKRGKKRWILGESPSVCKPKAISGPNNT